MILYLDISALVPLLLAERTSGLCGELWDASDARVCVRVGYVEAAAALAAAERSGRISAAAHEQSRDLLDALWAQIDVMEVTDELMRSAAAISRDDALRGYDALHCAAGIAVGAAGAVVTTGDRELARAWQNHGLVVVDTREH